MGSKPPWAWVCSVLDRQDEIIELIKCVLRPFWPVPWCHSRVDRLTVVNAREAGAALAQLPQLVVIQ